jgi:hypothetical protein
MADHSFCQALLRTVRKDLTTEQRRKLKGAWSWMDGRERGEFQVPSDSFYWYGSAHCAWDARQQGITAWLVKNYPEENE